MSYNYTYEIASVNTSKVQKSVTEIIVIIKYSSKYDDYLDIITNEVRDKVADQYIDIDNAYITYQYERIYDEEVDTK